MLDDWPRPARGRLAPRNLRCQEYSARGVWSAVRFAAGTPTNGTPARRISRTRHRHKRYPMKRKLVLAAILIAGLIVLLVLYCRPQRAWTTEDPWLCDVPAELPQKLTAVYSTCSMAE